MEFADLVRQSMILVAQRTVRDLCHAARLDWNRTYREQSTCNLSNIFDVVSLTVETNSCTHWLNHYRRKRSIRILCDSETIRLQGSL